VTKEAQRAEATVESEDNDAQDAQPTLLSAVLENMKGEAATPPQKTQPQEEEADATQREESEQTEEVRSEEEAETQSEEESQSEETEAEESEETAVEAESEEEVEAEGKEEWTPEQRAQIIDARRKAKKRTQERDFAFGERDQALALAQQWQATAQQLHAQLQQKRPTPTEQDPVADVINLDELQAAKRGFDSLLEQCERGLASQEDNFEIVTGYDAKGEPRKETVNRIQLTNMKLFAQRGKDRVPQKEALIQQQTVNNLQALEAYPEFQTNPQWNFVASKYLEMLPELRRMPNYLWLIGHALAGEREFYRKVDNAEKQSTNGQNLSESAKKIKAQVKFKPAPGIAGARSPVVSRRTSQSEIEAARERLRKEGTDEAREAFIHATLTRGGTSAGQEQALV
jgi:hypothetical protein